MISRDDKRREMAHYHEQCLIGSVLLFPPSLDEIADVEPGHFANHRHEAIFSTVREMYESSKHIDTATLLDRLSARSDFDDLNRDSYIASMYEVVPNGCHAASYAKIVRTNWLRRETIRRAHELVTEIDSADDVEIATAIERHLGQLADTATPTQHIEMKDLLASVWDDIQQRSKSKSGVGLKTGFAKVDQHLIGLRPGELIVIAARPACGKTAFVCSMAHRVALNGSPVMFFSLEMSAAELGERLLSIGSGVHGMQLKSGNVTDAEYDKLLRATSTLQEIPLKIDDNANMKVNRIASFCRRTKRKHGLGLIIVDYLQLIEPENRRDPREQQVAQSTRALKKLAKELQVPVIVLAQLNRQIETRNDKRPKLSDLRESGAIEQDADVVAFLHRPEVYDPADRPGQCDLLIEKNRRGPTGCVTLAWKAETTQFDDGAERFGPRDL